MHTNITISDSESNGPCIWISSPIEEIGDGDGHLEAEEWAAYHYFIYDNDGINYSTVYFNGNLSGPYYKEESPISPTEIRGIVHAQMTRQPNLQNNITIEVVDGNNNTNTFSYITYAPWYDFTAWTDESVGPIEVQAACIEPSSSLQDGYWLELHGGNPTRMPEMEMHYSGPQSINKQVGPGMISWDWRGLSGKFDMPSQMTLNVTPRTDIYVPFNTYAVYSEYNGNNTVSAAFYGTPNMSGLTFHVILLNLSEVSSKINLTNISTIFYSINNLTMKDIKNAEVDSADICANSSGDFVIDGTKLPDLNNMKQGYYALLVMDYNIPNVPCMVSCAPIIVTKSGMTVDPWEAYPMPGDTIHLDLSQLGAPSSGEYVYFAAIIYEKEYGACLNITSDGTANGTNMSLNGIVNLTNLKAALSNVSAGNSSVISNTSAMIALFTNKTQPPVRYVLLALAIDRNTGNVAAINQTYINLEATYTYDLVKGWNLISIPLTLEDNNISNIIPIDVDNNIVNYGCSVKHLMADSLIY